MHKTRATAKADTRPVRDRVFGPIDWAWSLHLSTSERLVTLALVEHDHIDRETKQRKAEVWPTQAKLATMTGLTDRTIRRSLQALEDKRVIMRTGRYAKSGGAVHYRMLYPAGPDVVSVPHEPSGPDIVSASNASDPDINDTRSGHGVRIDPDMVSDKQLSIREEETGEAARRLPHIETENPAPLAFARSATPDGFVDQSGTSHTQDEPGPSPDPNQTTEPNKLDRSGHGVRTDLDRAALVGLWIERCAADDNQFSLCPNDLFGDVIRRVASLKGDA